MYSVTIKISLVSLQDYYASIHGLLTQLVWYHLYTTNLMTQRHYREELAAAIFLGGLDTSISSQIRCSILNETHLLTLAIIFSSACRVSSETPLLPSSTPPPLASFDSTTLLSSNSKGKGHPTDGGRGRGRGHDGQSFPPCEHCQGTNHHSDHCWQKFCKPHWVANSASTDAFSSSSLSMMTISREDYDHLIKL